VLALTFTAAAAAFAFPAHPCRAPLPAGPVVPAPIVFRTSCGGFLLAADGHLSRLPRDWFAVRAGGTGRRWGATLEIRRNRAGRYFVSEHGRLLWRSHHLYPNDGGSVAFGPNRFAFTSYRRGIFVTDLHGPERLVMRGTGLNAYDFTDTGTLLVNGPHTLNLIAATGKTLRRFHFRTRNGFAFDEDAQTLYFVTPTGILARVHGTRLQLLHRVVSADGWLTLAKPRLLVFSSPRSITITHTNGRVVAQARWHSRRLHADAGVSVAANGRAFAFRLSDARPGKQSGTAIVYALRAGARHAHAVYAERLGPSGCAPGAGLGWHGGSILYSSSDGRLAVLTPATHHVIQLTAFSHKLPGESEHEHPSAFWRSELPR
jgi:hypothetical protein